MSNIATQLEFNLIEKQIRIFFSSITKEKPKIARSISGIIKIISKICLKDVVNLLHEQKGWVSKKGAKHFSIKHFPVIGGITGIALGILRIYHGEPKKAAIEILSGSLTYCAGMGTVFSLTLDAGLLFFDISEKDKVIDFKSSAYGHGAKVFGLNPYDKLTENSLNAGFTKVSKRFRPQKYARYYPSLHKRSISIQKQLEKIRSILIQNL